MVSTGNKIGDNGATSLSNVLKSNTTLKKLNMSCEDKRSNTQIASINKFNPFFSHQINRQQNWRGGSNIIKWYIEIKHNTHSTQAKRRLQKTTHKWHSSTNHSFFILIKSTGNNIGETGTASLSDSLKSNTTLTVLYL